jgi:Tfp pilus assembly protein PilX
MSHRTARRGAALMVALVTLLVVMLLTAAVLRSLIASHRQTRLNQYELQAQWLAEAGLARAAAQLANRPDYTGETWQATTSDSPSAETTGIVKIAIQPSNRAGERVVTVTAQYPDHPLRRATVVRERTIQK